MGAEPKHDIVIIIAPDGKITSEVKGVTGAACGPLTAWLQELGKVEVDRHTPDYYRPAQQHITTKS